MTLTLRASEALTVAGGKPILTLNDGGIATYVSGSGTTSLLFTTTVAAGQHASSLAATAVNLNGATIKDAAGNSANLSMTGLIQHGPQIDTSAPKAPTISSDTIHRRTATLTGTAEANTWIKVYDDGSKLVGEARTDSSGAWTLTTRRLPRGANVFTATATDAAQNTSAVSAPLDPIVGSEMKISSSLLGGDSSSSGTLGYQENDHGPHSMNYSAHSASLGLLTQYAAAGFHHTLDAGGGALVTHHAESNTIWEGALSLMRPAAHA